MAQGIRSTHAQGQCQFLAWCYSPCLPPVCLGLMTAFGLARLK